MTAAEMHIAFKLGLDKTNSLSYPSFLPEEIDFWLNQATRKFVKTRYSGVNPKREAFEQSQKRTDDLRTLVIEETLTPTETGATKTNGWLVDLDNLTYTYWFSLGEEVEIEYIPTTYYNPNHVKTTRLTGVICVTSDDYRSKIDDPLSEHILHYDSAKPLRLFYNDTIEFITDGNYDITEVYVRYIKQPAEIETGVTNCDLAEHTHDEIVNMAVQLALENIEQPRLQSYTQSINTME
jgi:hypothetical protein